MPLRRYSKVFKQPSKQWKKQHLKYNNSNSKNPLKLMQVMMMAQMGHHQVS
jgi:hypothetical protein